MTTSRLARLVPVLMAALGAGAIVAVLAAAAESPRSQAPQAPVPAPPGGAPPRTGPPPRPPTHEEKAEAYFKNIQVLKGYPADEVVPTMQFIAASLGVECEFCHVERANEKDDKKEKLTARKMISMTQAINRDSFEGKREVTCNSCHRGESKPVAIPAVFDPNLPREPEEGSPEAKAPELPAAGAVLDRYLAAVGGGEALEKITSRVQKGRMSGFGPAEMPIEVYAQAPDKRISIVHTPRGDSLTAFDGKAGWLGNSGRPARDMSAAESEAARLDADMRLPSHLKAMFKEFKVVRPEKIEGRDANHVIAMNEGRPPVDLWFDAESGLLVRMMRYSETILGRSPTRIDYADYRDADGVKIPYRWAISRPSGRFEIRVDDVQQNVPIEGSRFEKPASS
ncbi:MAG: c-type cytochrome [Acidobacteriia bacterium]|nr:c-type cytochrome [Terriglobia bacterium]